MENKKSKKKYELLTDQLLDLIKKNDMKQNDRLPTVREMIKEWNYSYATVHRTLLEMENKGLITRRQGKGMYVNKPDVKPAYKQVALIIPSHFSGFRIFIDILSGVRTALEEKKISLLISISNMSHEKEKVTIERLVARRVDGMIIFLEDHYRQDYSHITRLKETNFPFVLIDRFIPELDTDYVVVNNRDAMFKICSYLKYNRYCDKLFFVPDFESPQNISSSEEKLAGFKDAVNILYGTDSGTVISLDDIAASTHELSKTYKSFGVCMNHDGQIPILINRLEVLGAQLPSNCHIFGYNNSFETPIYPTVEQFNEKVGLKAAEILIERMEHPQNKSVQLKIEPKLVLPNPVGGFFMEN